MVRREVKITVGYTVVSREGRGREGVWVTVDCRVRRTKEERTLRKPLRHHMERERVHLIRDGGSEIKDHSSVRMNE